MRTAEKSYRGFARHVRFEDTGLTVSTGRALFRRKPIELITSEIDMQISRMPEAQRNTARIQAVDALYNLEYQRGRSTYLSNLLLLGGGIVGVVFANPVLLSAAIVGATVVTIVGRDVSSSNREAKLNDAAVNYIKQAGLEPKSPLRWRRGRAAQ